MPAAMTSSQRAHIILAIGVALLLVGCGRKLPPVGSAAPPMTNTGAPLTEGDAKEFSRKLVQAIKDGDTTTADHLLRVIEIAENSIASLDPPKGMIDGFKKGAAKMSLGTQLANVVQEGGTYKLLRIRTQSGRLTPIFRVLFATGGINYYETTLIRYPDGNVGADDIRIATSGEPISQTLRRLFIPLLAAGEKSMFKKVSDGDRKMIENLGVMENMTRVLRGDGNASEAFTKYRALPVEMQNNKVIQVLALQVAQQVGEKEFGEEVERFRTNYPTDSALNILSIDYFLMKKEYSKLLESLDKLNNQVGGDPYLDVMRGNMFLEMQDHAKAKESYSEAMEKEPDLFQAYDQALALSLANNDHDETLDLFKKYIQNCNFKFDATTLSRQPSYHGFSKTPQFEELKKWHADRK